MIEVIHRQDAKNAKNAKKKPTTTAGRQRGKKRFLLRGLGGDYIGSGDALRLKGSFITLPDYQAFSAK